MYHTLITPYNRIEHSDRIHHISGHYITNKDRWAVKTPFIILWSDSLNAMISYSYEKTDNHVMSYTYVPAQLTKDQLLVHHINTLTKINVKIDKCELPTFYWLPKLHKRPYKSRFISNSSHCSTTILCGMSLSCHVSAWTRWKWETSWCIYWSQLVIYKTCRLCV